MVWKKMQTNRSLVCRPGVEPHTTLTSKCRAVMKGLLMWQIGQGLADMLRGQHQLRALNLADTSLEDEGIEAVAQALAEAHPPLEELNLALNSFTPASVPALAQALAGELLVLPPPPPPPSPPPSSFLPSFTHGTGFCTPKACKLSVLSSHVRLPWRWVSQTSLLMSEFKPRPTSHGLRRPLDTLYLSDATKNDQNPGLASHQKLRDQPGNILML